MQADVRRLDQIMVNLLRNALRHTSPGGIVVVAAEAESDLVCIEVRDTDEGIAPEDLPRIWEPFYRGNAARHRDQADGTGLSRGQGADRGHGRPGGGGGGLLLKLARPNVGLGLAIPWRRLWTFAGLTFVGAWLVISIQVGISMRWKSFVVACGAGVALTIAGVFIIHADWGIFWPCHIRGHR